MQDNTETEVVTETNKKNTLKKNSLGQFFRKLERVVVPHGQTYNVGRNKAKAAKRKAKGKKA